MLFPYRMKTGWLQSIFQIWNKMVSMVPGDCFKACGWEKEDSASHRHVHRHQLRLVEAMIY